MKTAFAITIAALILGPVVWEQFDKNTQGAATAPSTEGRLVPGGHTWPGMEPIAKMLGPSTKDISANDLLWEFVQKHPRR